jgi:hypothetical protein
MRTRRPRSPKTPRDGKAERGSPERVAPSSERPRKMSALSTPSVFINCPFDRSYRQIFDAIVFAVMVLGFDARCALERETGTEERLTKILQIIGACKFGIHDLSFMRVDPGTKLPRFNMVLELGLSGLSSFWREEACGQELFDSGPPALALPQIAFGSKRPRHSGTQREASEGDHRCTELARHRIATRRSPGRSIHFRTIRAIPKAASEAMRED